MKNKLFTFLNLLNVGVLTACGGGLSSASVNALRSPEGLDHKYNYQETRSEEYLNFKNKLKIFAFKLADSFNQNFYSENKNLSCSPLSIELCLGLAVRSANGQTRDELLRAFDVDYETFNKFYKLYFNEMFLVSRDENEKIISQLLLTNSIWLDQRGDFVDAGLDALRDDYYCYSFEADFLNQNDAANKAIQDFIKDKTKGLIDPKLGLSIDTLFVLMNTLYLKDVWNTDGQDLPYTKEDYHFTNLNGEKSNKQLLSGYYYSGKALETEDFSSFHTSTCYYQLYFIKPNEGKDLKTVFTKDNIEYVLDSNNYTYTDEVKMERYHTNCIFPEFESESNESIIDMLKNDFDIKSLFVPGACDLTNVTTTPETYIQEVTHITKLKVDKTGIEGAAVTIMAGGAAGYEEDPYTDVYESFVVDKEFGFVIVRNDRIIFSGTVTNIDK